MHRYGYKALAALSAVGLAAGLAALSDRPAEAADHTDPPALFGTGGTATSNAADIADLYAWSDGTNMNVILTFAGFSTPTAENDGAWTQDQDVLYTIHIDTDTPLGEQVDGETEIYVRFGPNGAGAYGLQVENFPGAAEPVSGPVGQANAVATGGQFYAGVHDDPFFFDLTGFTQTVANLTDPDDMNVTPDLALDGTDTLAGTNTSAIVLQFPLTALTTTDGTPIQVWATTKTPGATQ